jgi:hypothetical protein
MPLPSSGQISINDIRNELLTSNGSLGALSDLAGFSRPDAMSDFYNYNAYNLIEAYLAPGSPCNAANQNIYQNVGNDVFYAQDAYSPGAYTPAYDFSEQYYLYNSYNEFFDAYVYDYWEVNSTSTSFIYQGTMLSFCAPS